ncbi:MAG: flavodoxin family protein [Desulfobacterales bacterium]|nr:flavodoxin family protein [Desulfobacterales bacterium]
MKSLVIYSSRTGNTKKLAEAVFESMSGDKAIYPVTEAPDPEDYDFIAVGFWLMAGKPDPKTMEYLSGIGSGKRLFLFATHGAAIGSAHVLNAMNYAKTLAPNAEYAGEFNCRGEVDPKVLEKVMAKPQPPVWLHDASNAVGHPDAADIEKLKRIIGTL